MDEPAYISQIMENKTNFRPAYAVIHIQIRFLEKAPIPSNLLFWHTVSHPRNTYSPEHHRNTHNA